MKLFQKPDLEIVFDTLISAETHLRRLLKVDSDDPLIETNKVFGVSDFKSNVSEIKYYETEDFEQITNIRLFKIDEKYLIQKWNTYKHPMITAAISDDIDEFKAHFRKDQIKINLAFQLALECDSKSIYKYLIKENIPLTNDPIYRTILYDNVNALDLLLSSKYAMKNNWLIQAVEYESVNIIEEFLYKRKFEFNLTNSSYFHSRVIQSDYPDLERLIEFLKTHYGLQL